MSASDLSQMGIASVAKKVNDDGHTVIEKCPVGDVEYAFYHSAATELKQAGIATPTLWSSDATMRKLTLEFIPHPVEQSFVASDNAIRMLGRLHRYPVNSAWRYHTHQWSASALQKSLLLLAIPEKCAQQLRRFQQCSDVLFSGQGLVSGDSNAGNWGRRENGEWVLFDWERFGQGSPGIDLAPLIKGMGTKQTFIDLAERYCQLSGQHNVHDLAREIAIAKAWIVTEVIVLLDARQKRAFPLYLNWYQEHLPEWLNDTVKML
ncbi:MULTISPECIES: phosphotransferase family protein [unclassified Leclercia]|uniref:Aminoglycoside phosphotransferase n=1 Tax=Leclercia barmai TaxID=2785629 RepID=A0ABS7RSH6_9ENTR|nr:MULTISPECIES: phosphotransferase [unclassified Leclercia]MBZ0057269.1 aminoglycoside phosphotransferase [Leclercia sp. EMC7]MCM5695439.1 aminoglycoside phosphotransferase [Leclercia sp. LTM01]MCM5699846.1 aminoglycoside phosphotransferase [Leclercia sp. LTM14]